MLKSDSEEDVKRKIKNSFCPMGIAEGNPVMDIMKIIIFPSMKEVTIHRPEKKGGDITFTDFISLESTYKSGAIHPMDLKESVTDNLSKMMKPFAVLRDYLEK